MTTRTTTHRFRTRLVAIAAAATAVTGGMVAAADPASAVTDPDRSICQDGSGSNPPGLYLRNPDSIGEVRGFYIRTGWGGSTDHFYITGEFTKENGAHWWVGNAYHDGVGTYGAVLDSWVAASHASCG